MTFTEIVNEVAGRTGLVSTAAITRIGREVNIHYRRLTSSLGLQVGRRLTAPVTAACSVGSQLLTFTGIEKIERVIDTSSGSVVVLDEVTEDEIRSVDPGTGDPAAYSIVNMGASSVTIRLDTSMQDTRELKADGLATASTLSGSQVPAFSEDFHDILIERVWADELRIAESGDLALVADATATKRTSELRLFIAKGGLSLQQGKLSGNNGAFNGGAGSGSSGVNNVQNSGAATDNAIARFDGTGGRSIQNSGITIADGAAGTLAGSNSGDVTLAGSPDYLTIVGQAITRALINLASHVTGRLPFANLTAATAASRLFGRRSASAGDFEEISLGTGLSMSGTTLNGKAVAGSTTQVQFNDGGEFGGDAGLVYDKATDILTMGEASLTGGRIAFPAAQNASTNANTLDDYEEGSWTPALGGTGGQSGQVYTAQVGRYVKIGKWVHCQGRIVMSTLGTVTTQAQITGLPFTIENTTNVFAGLTVHYFNSMTSTLVWLSGAGVPNGTVVPMYRLTAAGVGVGSLVQADMSNTTDIIFSISYRASS